MRQITIFTRIFIYIFVFFAGLMLAFGSFIYYSSADTLQKQIGNKCIGIASAVAVLIEQDTDGYKEFIQTLDKSSAYYKKIKPALEEIRSSNEGNIIYLYTEIRASENKMMYILDGEKEGATTFSPPGSTDFLTKSRLAAYQKQANYIGDFVTNDWGTLLSAYAPIHDSKTGEFIGLVGADVSIDQYNDVMQYQFAVIASSVFMLILIVAVILLLSSERVERLLVKDSLTGLYNKSYFLFTLKGLIKHAKKKNLPVVVFMADLDHFKKINDTYGHPFGDVVLEAVSRTMSANLRKTDCLARYGGEEFSAYLTGIDLERAQTVITRIKETIAASPIYNADLDEYIKVTISIGATQLTAEQNVNSVLEKADKALYKAKLTRNTVCFHT